jgi:hypothetical protein
VRRLGFFAEFQDLFDAKFDGALDAFFCASKDSATRTGRSLNHRCCRKKNKKVQMFDHLVSSEVLANATTNSSSSS